LAEVVTRPDVGAVADLDDCRVLATAGADWRIQLVDAEVSKLRQQLDDCIAACKGRLAVTVVFVPPRGRLTCEVWPPQVNLAVLKTGLDP